MHKQTENKQEQDIFTKDIGGGYIGSKLIGANIGEEQLYEKWRQLKTLMTDKDMYIQYSSGHGDEFGIGLLYKFPGKRASRTE